MKLPLVIISVILAIMAVIAFVLWFVFAVYRRDADKFFILGIGMCLTLASFLLLNISKL